MQHGYPRWISRRFRERVPGFPDPTLPIARFVTFAGSRETTFGGGREGGRGNSKVIEASFE